MTRPQFAPRCGKQQIVGAQPRTEPTLFHPWFRLMNCSAAQQ